MALTEGEDYYMEGPMMVFTAAFHRKRGYCCRSGCRHCPYGDKEEGCKESSPLTLPPDLRIVPPLL